MGFSSLISKQVLADSSNYTKGRNGKKICKFTPHHMAGKASAEQCAKLFQDPNRAASANYCIGYDGTIVGCVDEEDRAWTSSSASNDNQAITVEVSNSSAGGDWPISEASWNALVALAVDVCSRYNFRLSYDGTPEGSLTRHNMFAATACPGPYLQGRFEELVKTVNTKLDGVAPTPESYLVRVTTDVLNIRAEAGTNHDIVGQITDRGVYTITAEATGEGASKWGKLKSGAGWISLDYTEPYTETAPIVKGCRVKFTGTKSYSGIQLADWVTGYVFNVIEISGDRVVIGKGSAVTAAVNIYDCQRV